MTVLEFCQMRLSSLKIHNPESPEVERYEKVIIPDLIKSGDKRPIATA